MNGFNKFKTGQSNTSDRTAMKNLADDLYLEETVGIIENTYQMIYDDMALDNDGTPSGKPSSFGQYHSGTIGPLATHLADKEDAVSPYDVEPYLSAPDGYYEWSKTNFWYETDLELEVKASCEVGITTARNSCIEVSNGEAFWLDDEGRESQPDTWVWKSIFGNEVPHQTWGTINNSGISSACVNANGDAFEAVRAATNAEFPNFNVSPNVGPNYLNVGRLANGNVLINPINGYRCHAWLESNGLTEPRTVQAIYACMYFRLVLIDPDGVDDRADYNQLVHVASDIRNDQNVFPPCCPYWGVGGLSRYKRIPNNGDWMPINFISFKYDSDWSTYTPEKGEETQLSMARIEAVAPPIVMSPNP